MYNHQLDTFIKVAGAGSFNKASEELYISPNAVMKQINLLEQNTGITLFKRTHKGLKLTLSGQSLYHDAKYMIQYSKEAIIRAKNKEKEAHVIKIGVSLTTPVSYLISLWNKLSLSGIKFELISFENTPDNAQEIMKNFGKTIDIVAGIYSQNLLNRRQCTALHLYDTPLCLAVPLTYPLADKEIITYKDLSHQSLLLLKQNYLDDFDNVRRDLILRYSDIHIEDVPFFNIHVFNQCVNENKVMIAVKEWKDIHPMLKMIPIEWNHTIPFGIMYSLNPTEDVQMVIDALEANY